MSRQSANKQSPSTSTLSDTGPSQILPFLYVGCQDDAISNKTMQDIHITHVINVSTTGDRPSFLNENDSEHFLRIPVNDCSSAQILPYFDKAYAFIEKARMNNGRVFIHCLAGISRSPTLAIAYIMRYLHLSFDNAYKFLKERRPQISPNFNFAGQLTEYERNLSLPSDATASSAVKCVAIETPLNDRRRFVQAKCCSSPDNSIKPQTNGLSRPNTLLSTTENLSQSNVLTPKLKRPTLDLKETKRTEIVPKIAENFSSTDRPELINTYSQGSTPSTDEWTTPPLIDSTSETKTSDVLSSSRKLLIL